MDLQISGGKLYALENRGLSIYDLSDKLSPKLLGRIDGRGRCDKLELSETPRF